MISSTRKRTRSVTSESETSGMRALKDVRILSCPPSPPISPVSQESVTRPSVIHRIYYYFDKYLGARLVSLLGNQRTIGLAKPELIRDLETLHLSAITLPETFFISVALLKKYLSVAKAPRRPGLHTLVLSIAYISAKLVEVGLYLSDRSS
jgi:hypothetical protein